jgi:hypothetical protein
MNVKGLDLTSISTSESIHGLGRLYQITATIDPDGKATLVWKLRKNRP